MVLINQLITLFVAGLATGSPVLFKRGDITIGYRTVGKAEADKINKKTLVFEQQFVQPAEIGDSGIYVSAGPGDFFPDKGEWMCKITADEGYFNGLEKAWVPSHQKDDEWWPENEMKDFLKKEIFKDDKKDVSKVVRLSKTKGEDNEFLQMLLPGGVVNEGKFKVECFEQKGEDDEYPDWVDDKPVKYKDWNAKGDKQEAGENKVPDDVEGGEEQDD